MRRTIFLLFLITFSAVFLRFYKLSENPPGLYVDEAAIGYNAYSILLTGKDEYGKPLPIFFRSFGDYKLPLYIYLSTLPIKIFGLTAFAVRFISAFFGSLTTVLIYLLVRAIFKEKNSWLGLLAGFVYAISPWSVLFSRAAFEAPLALFLFLSGFYLQLIAFKKNRFWLVIFSSIFYALSSYTYHTERFLVPLFAVATSLLFIKEKQFSFASRKLIIIFLIFLFFLIWPLHYLFPSFAGQARIKNLSILTTNQSAEKELVIRNLPRRLFALYSAYFSPRNLFFDSDSDLQRSLPQLSVFYSWMVGPFLLGLTSFFRKKMHFGLKMTAILLFLSPLPASLATDPFSSLRALPLIFPLLIIITLGLEKMFFFFKNILNYRLLFFLLVILFFFSLASLWRSLFILLPQERFSNWFGGYSNLTEKLKQNSFGQVLIDDPSGVSYIEFLFFQKYSPRQYQKGQTQIIQEEYYQVKDWEKKFQWDRFAVRQIDWRKDVYSPQLIVANPIAVSESQAEEHFLTRAFAIINPRQEVIFNAYQTNPGKKIEDDRLKLRQSKR